MANSSSAPTHPMHTSYYSTACGMTPTLIYMVNNLKVRELEAEPKLDQIQEMMAQLETANAAQSTNDRNQKKDNNQSKGSQSERFKSYQAPPQRNYFWTHGYIVYKAVLNVIEKQQAIKKRPTKLIYSMSLWQSFLVEILTSLHSSSAVVEICDA